MVKTTTLLFVLLLGSQAALADNPPAFALKPLADYGCESKTLGVTKYQFWNPVDEKPGGYGWKIIVRIAAKDTLRHIASNKGTLRDEHGWVKGYKDRKGTTWEIELEDGWEVLAQEVHKTNCLLSKPGEEPVRLNAGFGGDMVDLDWAWDGAQIARSRFTIHRKSLNGWWGGSYWNKGPDGKPVFGSYMDTDMPLQNIEIHFRVFKDAE